GILATYFVVKDRYVPYVVCASCMVLLKETAIVVVVALLLYRFLVMHSFRHAKFRDVALYSVPLAVIGGFFFLQKVATGQFFFIYDFDVKLFQLTPGLVGSQFVLITQWIFIDQFRFIFTALIAVNLLVTPNARRRELWLFAFLVVLSGYSFAVLFYLPRYLLPILPMFCILCAVSVLELARSPKRQLIAAAVALGVVVGSHFADPIAPSGETSLRYLDIVAMNKSAIDRIASDRPAARVLTTWPHIEEMTRPILGYVEEPLRVKSLEADSSLAQVDVILVSQPANGPEVRLRELAQTDEWQLVLRQKNETAWVELYTRNPTAALPSR
ncbi:MAG: hypothetical protein H7Z14_15455, partial [Anaerolineae bacterium]|nr:hypothetical protein [Phycisphaerae bacterium]